MINQFGYAQSPFVTGVSTVPQRVVGLPIQTPAVPVQYVAVPVEAVTPRITPTAVWVNPLAMTNYPAAHWQATSLYGGIPTFGVPQSFGIQGLPASQCGVYGTPVLQTCGVQGLPIQQAFGVQGLPIQQAFGVQGLPIQQAFGVQAPQVPHTFASPILQSVNWGGHTGLDWASGLPYSGYEFLPTTQATVAATQTPRMIYI